MFEIEDKVNIKSKELYYQEEIRNLEQRGYDSSGIIVHTSQDKSRNSLSGCVDLDGCQWNEQPYDNYYETQRYEADSYINLTPYTFSSDPLQFTVIHKGTIHNYKALKESLMNQGYDFESDSCSEVVSYMISNAYDGNLAESVQRVTAQLEGDYILVVMT